MRLSPFQPFTVTIRNLEIRRRTQESEDVIVPLLVCAFVLLYFRTLACQQMLPLIDRQNHRSLNPATRDDLRPILRGVVDHLAELCFCVV